MLTDPIVPETLCALLGGSTLTVLVAALRDRSRSGDDLPATPTTAQPPKTGAL